ncbi:hypothetical protein PINS_up008897 [Pythium insidiosum]|nr:hypothetical protein PINS_up008897 [Pythium insidiosum]
MKEQVLKEVIRVLRPGGELQFTDIFSSRRLPESVRKDDVLYSECFGGALYTEDFKRLCRQLGFGEPRELSRTPMEIKSGALADMVGLASFYSITYRCFKTPETLRVVSSKKTMACRHVTSGRSRSATRISA